MARRNSALMFAIAGVLVVIGCYRVVDSGTPAVASPSSIRVSDIPNYPELKSQPANDVRSVDNYRLDLEKYNTVRFGKLYKLVTRPTN